MKFKVDKDILHITTKCRREFRCQEDISQLYCMVEECIDGKVHFIKCLNEEVCNYKISFGHSLVCTCPARKEIYNKYKV